MRLQADTPDQLAAVLRGYRKSKGLTQDALGSKVGLLQKTVSAMETDPASSSIASLFKLLSALNLRVALEPQQVELESSASEW